MAGKEAGMRRSEGDEDKYVTKSELKPQSMFPRAREALATSSYWSSVEPRSPNKQSGKFSRIAVLTHRL